jgi:26S proteasome regulatory subunit N2
MPPLAESTALTTCAGVLALLEEEDSTLKIYALNQINRIVDVFWAEIADSISSIESLYEDEKFESRELAALIASKVFYHLGEYNDSLTYALGAGNFFDVHSQDEYVETLVAKCIDQYIQQRMALSDGKAEAKPIDPRLEAVVEKMFDRCFRDHEYKQAAGIAIESHRLEKMEEAIRLSDKATGTPKDCGGVTGMLAHCLQISQTHVYSREFRNQILRSLVKIYQALEQPDHINTCQCLMFLDDHEAVAGVLDSLLKGSDDDELMSYQVAFDLAENELQHFLIRVRNALPDPAAKAAAAQPTTSDVAAEGEKPADGESAEATMADAEPTDEEKKYIEKMGKLKQVLSGEVRMGLYLDFLHRHNHADMMILKQMKGSFEARNSVCHSGTVLANALMHCGTTSDLFVRENMDSPPKNYLAVTELSI